MQITQGLFEHMVLQRDARDKSHAEFAGSTQAKGAVEARVLKGKATLKGWNWKSVGSADGAQCKGVIKGVLVGGPYTIELRVVADGKAVDRCVIKDVLVGDVWIAAGQSNMQGCGRVGTELKPDPRVRAFYMDDRWAVAFDTIHNMWDCVDQVHVDINGGARPMKDPPYRTGPAVAFGQDMLKRTRVPQGLLACAHGGTHMGQWDPIMRDMGGHSLYGATLRRVRKNGGRVAGVIWYQGESDANGGASAVYAERMVAFVDSLRRDLAAPKLPFVMVQIGCFATPGDATHWESIRNQQRLLPESINRLATVPSVDLALDDIIHIGGEDQHRLGRRLAHAAASIIGLGKNNPPPITLKRIKVERNARLGSADVIVEFDNVVGKLRSAGLPVGFAIGDPRPGTYIFATELRDNRVILHSTLPMDQLEAKTLGYGLGYMPVCNITDQADRSLPAFGPLPVTGVLAVTPFVQQFSVSSLLPSAARLDGLECPADLGALNLQTRNLESSLARHFADLHSDIRDAAPQDHLVYLACRLECSEPMQLAARFGYDGPVKLWVDGNELLHDPLGRNPAIPDAKWLKFDVTAGSHEVLVALGTNQGKAWGIFLRFERRDVDPKLLSQSPEKIVLPRVTPV